MSPNNQTFFFYSLELDSVNLFCPFLLLLYTRHWKIPLMQITHIYSKIYSKVTKIIIQDLDEVYARLITVTTNCRVIKDPYLHKVLNFCYNYCYVQGVDSLQKISVQLCCRGKTEVSHFPFHKKHIITLNTS